MLVLALGLCLTAAEPAPAPTTPALHVSTAAAGPVATFTDKDGAHTVTFVLQDGAEKPDGTRSRTLTVTHDVIALQTTTPRRVWVAKDFVLDCPVDVTLELVDGSLALTDLDRDGQAELSFAYALSCKGDVSPDDMKLLLYEGATKFALRGTRAVHAGEVDASGKPVLTGGGPPAVDAAFDKGPGAFRTWALERWRALQPR